MSTALIYYAGSPAGTIEPQLSRRGKLLRYEHRRRSRALLQFRPANQYHNGRSDVVCFECDREAICGVRLAPRLQAARRRMATRLEILGTGVERETSAASSATGTIAVSAGRGGRRCLEVVDLDASANLQGLPSGPRFSAPRGRRLNLPVNSGVGRFESLLVAVPCFLRPRVGIGASLPARGFLVTCGRSTLSPPKQAQQQKMNQIGNSGPAAWPPESATRRRVLRTPAMAIVGAGQTRRLEAA